MMKRFLLILAALIASPSLAQEVHPDSGMTTATGVMEHGDTANVSISGGKAHFTAPNKMTALYWTAPVKRGRWYRATWTVSKPASVAAAGSVQASVGQMMQSSIAGSWIDSPNAPGIGANAIADNFTTANGLTTISSPTHVNGESGADAGAFRILCGAGAIKDIDPLVYPGLAGASHPHQFFGNTGVQESSTPVTLRKTGSTTCGNASEPNSPINRSAYWLPPIMNMAKGKFVNIDWLNLYYKEPNNTSDAVQCAGQDGTGSCVNMPRQMRMITGYNIAADTGKPDGGTPKSFWVCISPDGNEYGSRGSMTNAITNCVAGGYKKLHWQVAFQNCWDGVHLDSPNHRDHVAETDTFGKCPSTHKYQIPHIGLLVYWTLDADAFAGKWRMASDSMNPGIAPGDSAHTDYMEAWSPTVLDTLWTYCILLDLSCSTGDLGNGTSIKTGPKNIPSGVPTGYGPSNGRGRYVSMGPTGLGTTCYVTAPATSKTCTSDIRASADGVLGLISHDGANLDVDEYHVYRITRAGGPRVISN